VPVVAAFSATRPARAAAETLGSWFADRLTAADMVIAAATAILAVVILAAIAGGIVAVAGIATAVLGGLVAVAVVALRRRFDGDGMGAIVELSVVAGLASAAVVVVP
jgi:hypothetical protein